MKTIWVYSLLSLVVLLSMGIYNWFTWGELLSFPWKSATYSEAGRLALIYFFHSGLLTITIIMLVVLATELATLKMIPWECINMEHVAYIGVGGNLVQGLIFYLIMNLLYF